MVFVTVAPRIKTKMTPEREAKIRLSQTETANLKFRPVHCPYCEAYLFDVFEDNDDDILIPGHLIKRRFRKPVFYPFDMRSGFGNEIVNNENLIVEYSTEAYRKFYKDNTTSSLLSSLREENSFLKGLFSFYRYSQTTRKSRNLIYFNHRGSGGFDMSNSLVAVHPELIAESSRYDESTIERFRELFTRITVVLVHADGAEYITVKELREQVQKSHSFFRKFISAFTKKQDR